MSISSTIAPIEPKQHLGEQRDVDRACFGVHNRMDEVWPRNIERRQITTHGRLANFSQELEVIEFWPHVGMEGYEQKALNAVEVMNSMSCFKDLFTLTAANSISVNLRNNPADKVFTGLMTIRDMLSGYFGGLEFLYEGIDDKEELLKRKRLELVLRLAGMSRNFFGGWDTGNLGSTSDESTAIYFDEYSSAASLLPLYCDTDEYSESVWVQNPVGVGRNSSGYIRNYSQSALREVIRAKYNNPSEYSGMSMWLDVWVSSDGCKREVIDQKRNNLTLSQFMDRIVARTNGVESAEKANVVVSLFDDLVEYYNE